MRRLLVLLALVLAAPVATGSALADPVKNPHATYFDVACGADHYTVVVSTDPSVPGHILDGTGNIVLKGVSGVDPDSGPFSFLRPGFQVDELTTCTSVFTNALGHTFDVTLYAIITPRR